jgi:Calcineurin-like phosphoesterase
MAAADFNFYTPDKVLMPAGCETHRFSRPRAASLARFKLRATGLVTLALAAIAAPRLAPAETHAWVELVGPGRQASIRAIVSNGAGCPTLTVDGVPLRMQVRADPGPIFPNSDVPGGDDFPVLVCEVAAPAGNVQVLLEGNSLPLPRADVRRIVMFGDTGCRIKKKKMQKCDNPNKWPYADLAKRAAQARPDLVIHVGDYLYRESCRKPACANIPTGYGWKEWKADFFKPSKPLFAAAPWIMVRGNHENCKRAADGWFRLLYHAHPPRECPDVSPFFVADPGGLGFVVMDSAAVARVDDPSSADDDNNEDDNEAGLAQADDVVDKIRREYLKIAGSVPAPAWLLTHSPFNAVRVDKATGETKADNTIEQQAVGDILSPDIAMIVSGDIHLFEALNFGRSDPPRRPQLVVGTGGVKRAKEPETPTKVDGVSVTDALILREFAYMVWDRHGSNWKGELFKKDGERIARCTLTAGDLTCQRIRVTRRIRVQWRNGRHPSVQRSNRSWRAETRLQAWT